MWLKNLLLRDSEDCLVCALRAFMLLGFFSTYTGVLECSHAENISRLRQSGTALFFAVLINLLAVVGMSASAYQFLNSDDVTVKMWHSVLMIKFSLCIVQIFTLLIHNTPYTRSVNALMEVFHKPRTFGIGSILTRSLTKKLQIISLIYLLVMLAYTAAVFSQSLLTVSSFSEVLIALSILVLDINAMNYSISIFVLSYLYYFCLRECYGQIRKALSEACRDKREDIQNMQRFYLMVCRGYTRHFQSIGSSVFFFIVIALGISLIVQCHFHRVYVENVDEVEVVQADPMLLVIYWSVTCVYGNWVYHSVSNDVGGTNNYIC